MPSLPQKTFHRSKDPRTLAPEEFQRWVQTNPYIGEIYSYPDCILTHPTKESFQEIWKSKGSASAAIHVEIGCGSGAYLQELSLRFPEHRFIGMELRYKRLVLTARKLKKKQCHNVLLLKEYGERLHEYLEPQSLSALHVNFPDPWAKKAQRKHRLLSSLFFKNMHPLFQEQGRFFFKTDHHEYFQSVFEILKELPNYKIHHFTKDLHQSPLNEGGILTEFEQLFKSKENPAIAYLEAEAVF